MPPAIRSNRSERRTHKRGAITMVLVVSKQANFPKKMSSVFSSSLTTLAKENKKVLSMNGLI